MGTLNSWRQVFWACGKWKPKVFQPFLLALEPSAGSTKLKRLIISPSDGFRCSETRIPANIPTECLSLVLNSHTWFKQFSLKAMMENIQVLSCIEKQNHKTNNWGCYHRTLNGISLLCHRRGSHFILTIMKHVEIGNECPFRWFCAKMQEIIA